MEHSEDFTFVYQLRRMINNNNNNNKGYEGVSNVEELGIYTSPGPAAISPETSINGLLTRVEVMQVPISRSRTCCGVKVGLSSSTIAARPLTTGAAIEVPLSTLYSASP